LYLFALLAAGTGSLKLGALVMAAFWLGSIPLLVGLVAGTRLLNGRAGRLLPFAASLLLVIAGAYTASGRGLANLSGGLKVSSVLLEQLKEGARADSIDAATIQTGIEQLVATPLPCCQDDVSKNETNALTPCPNCVTPSPSSERGAGDERVATGDTSRDDDSLAEGSSP
jgi:sulfite exporter TauE/SafE